MVADPSGLPLTGLPDFDNARWLGRPRLQDVHNLAGAGVLRHSFDADPARFAVDVDRQQNHILLWTMGAAPGRYDIRLDGRRDDGPLQGLRNAYLLPAGTASRFEGPAGPQHDMLHLHVTPPWLDRLAEESGLPASAARLPLRAGLQDPALDALVRALVAQRAAHGRLSAAFAEQWAVLAMLRLMRAPPPSGRIALAGWRLQRVFAHVEANLATDLPLSDLAAAAGLSRFHFARAFRAETGETPHGYISRRRCDLAKRLILAGGLPLSEVALRCGFASQAHFTHAFARIVGTTPGRWRADRLA
ncbi:AraC family transcriptional regulator [Paracraurococcus ruber]|uniref:helix-turn-helix domain-containing protein n=1 Tax=Paracraurococcus ruber TaxID=77675 RepID=UPI0010579D03|nr:AraC family transcriptional regulator [Paracraurococcus ruber]TDG05757.1 AraC family transcriptional regulator [Paracraurococcus ruber]